jgi:hypothetical protein
MSRRVCWLYGRTGWTIGLPAVQPVTYRVEKEGADVTTLTASPLTATDRCDRCGAQAYIRATLTSGSELMFCAHHAREYETGLRAIEAEIHDEADRLVETPATAAVEER